METKSRLLALDQFRGTAIVLMVLANAMEHYQHIPAYLKHAPQDGFYFPDIVAPMFLFAIGFAAELSFQSRVKKHGVRKTVLHFLLRNGVLFAFGLIGTLLVAEHGWDILQTLGTAGLMAIPLLFLKPAARLAIALLSAVAYQMTVSGGFGTAAAQVVSHGELRAPLMLFSQIFMLISGSCLSAWLKGKPLAQRTVWLAVAGTILIVAEIGLSLLVPYRKGALCFVLLCSGICAYGLLLFSIVSERLLLSIQPLEALGKNALVCYMLSSVLILAERAILRDDVSTLAGMTGALSVLLLTYLAGTILDRKGLYIKL